MKSYKDFRKECIGDSDIASLVLAGHRDGIGLVTTSLHFGGDDTYYAYIVEGEAEIGSHYKKVAEFQTWLKIYDDFELTARFNGKRIIVYRAAQMGCIIQIIN